MNENSFYYKLLHTKYLPTSIGKLLVILTSWIFQSIFFVDLTERIFKILLNLILFFIFYFLWNTIEHYPSRIICSFIFGHTISWMVNDHPFVALKNIGISYYDSNRITEYSYSLYKRLLKERRIKAAAIFGSLSEGKLTNVSDLDIRLLRYNGIINALFSLLYITKERFIATALRFPLHIYVFDDIDMLFKKYGVDNVPIILIDHDDVLLNKYINVKYL